MNRFAQMLCLLGLVLFTSGLGMMLRFLTWGYNQGGMVDPLVQADAGALRYAAAPDVLGTYLLALAAGSGFVVAGLAALLARRWRN